MIKLVDNFYLDADDRNYILKEWDGKTVTDAKGITRKVGESNWYYGDIENLIKHLLDLYVRRGISNSNTEYLSQLADVLRIAIEKIIPVSNMLYLSVAPSIDGKAEIRGRDAFE